jgi:uncharacterized membrane protein YdbT with pleckstrin-like domain
MYSAGHGSSRRIARPRKEGFTFLSLFIRIAAIQGELMEQELDRFRASTRQWLLGSFRGWATLCLCLVGVGLVVVAVKWWRNISARYVLTDQRLIFQTGVILKQADEIELFRVKDIRVDYSLANQLTGIGTISIVSSDASTHARTFILRDVPKAIALRETLRNLVDQARRARQVREIDVDEQFA